MTKTTKPAAPERCLSQRLYAALDLARAAAAREPYNLRLADLSHLLESGIAVTEIKMADERVVNHEHRLNQHQLQSRVSKEAWLREQAEEALRRAQKETEALRADFDQLRTRLRGYDADGWKPAPAT